MKNIAIALIILLAACHSNQKTNIEQAAALDSAANQAQSQINRMVDEMAPPDSSYSGDFFLKYDNGLMKVKGFFRFGQRHGQWYYYFPNGYVWSEGLFDNGKMNGPSKVYHENGKLYYEGVYKLDKPVGVWNFYDTSGVLILMRSHDSTGKIISDKPVASTDKK